MGAMHSAATEDFTPYRRSPEWVPCSQASSSPRSVASNGSGDLRSSPVGPGSLRNTGSPTPPCTAGRTPSRGHDWCGGPQDHHARLLRAARRRHPSVGPRRGVTRSGHLRVRGRLLSWPRFAGVAALLIDPARMVAETPHAAHRGAVMTGGRTSACLSQVTFGLGDVTGVRSLQIRT
jgi:hypothetical protein